MHHMCSFYFWIVTAISLGTIHAAEPITARDATIDNVQLHYLTAGHGPATVILLHGFAETSRMWRPIIPVLAEKFTVIAPDLPGIGDSSIPDKIDMLEAAKKTHALARSLNIDKARVVGHDIGLMVAYAYAAKFPNETEKLAVMDAFLPGVPGWEPIYNAPNARGMDVFRVVAAVGERFRAAFTNETDDAGVVDRR